MDDDLRVVAVDDDGYLVVKTILIIIFFDSFVNLASDGLPFTSFE